MCSERAVIGVPSASCCPQKGSGEAAPDGHVSVTGSGWQVTAELEGISPFGTLEHRNYLPRGSIILTLALFERGLPERVSEWQVDGFHH